MRDVATTALEVAGMILIAVAIALVVGAAWVGFGLAGAVLLTVGVLEGRR